jgi:uncharacterized hydrophobic protein (TIGR00271 family)
MEIDPNQKDIFIEKNFFSNNIPVEERTAVFNSLFFHYKENWKSSFGLMLILSIGIASLGLSENSTATIIGAMIIAPLGHPIVALGGAIALGWRKQSFRMLGIIIIGTFISIILAYLVGLTLTDVTANEQILIRTSPDLRDIGIAVFAGTAGAYGYYRSEFSTVLSGVAIAVALVPPLCVSGLMIEEGHYILAKASFLLFATNFVGITFSTILVFFLLGLRQKHNRKWFYKGTIIVILTGASIIIPLALNFNSFNSAALFQSSIYAKTSKVLDLSKDSPVIKDISIQGGAAIIVINPFPKNPEDIDRLTSELERSTGLQIFLQSADKQ